MAKDGKGAFGFGSMQFSGDCTRAAQRGTRPKGAATAFVEADISFKFKADKTQLAGSRIFDHALQQTGKVITARPALEEKLHDAEMNYNISWNRADGTGSGLLKPRLGVTITKMVLDKNKETGDPISEFTVIAKGCPLKSLADEEWVKNTYICGFPAKGDEQLAMEAEATKALSGQTTVDDFAGDGEDE